MNQHMLLHLKESVINHGPLWSSSLFVFEDWNGDISNYFHRTQNIAGQVSLRFWEIILCLSTCSNKVKWDSLCARHSKGRERENRKQKA